MSWITEMLFPRRCLLCEQLLLPKETASLCDECQIEQYVITGPHCRICSRTVSEEGAVCISCLMHGTTVSGKSILEYRGAVRDSIHRFKYENQKSYAAGYAGIILRYAHIDEAVCFVPIPIHKKRLRERGYNQALELCRELTKRTGIPTMELLERVKNTSVQNRLSSQARRENLEGAFEAVKMEVPKGTLILVDDIYTSGATIETAAAVLQKAYPDHTVRFLTLAMRI